MVGLGGGFLEVRGLVSVADGVLVVATALGVVLLFVFWLVG